MTDYEFDLLTIGGGSGGVRASRMSASHGARVALVEKRDLGGTCVNLGCVPKKLMSYAGHFRDELEDAVPFGWNATLPAFEWARLIQNKDAEIARLNRVYQQILMDAGVTIIEGHARFLDPHTVEIGERRVTAERVLIATGGRPIIPTIPGSELVSVSDHMFHLERMPERLLVIGGGYIAVEFASIMRGLGAKVTLVHRGHAVLRGFDEDVRSTLTDHLSAHGIELRLLETVERVERSQDGLRATLKGGATIDADLVLCAIGRQPNTEGLGLERAGVALDQEGSIVVDDRFVTNVPHIYALGDVIDRVQLTPVALAEANAFASTVFGGWPLHLDYEHVPSAVFTNPPVATVGLTEAQAMTRYGAADVFISRFRPLKATITGRAEKAMMKLVVDPESDRVLGAHMIGPDAPEIVQGLAIALRCGATKADFDRTIGIHPTVAEEFVTMRSRAQKR